MNLVFNLKFVLIFILSIYFLFCTSYLSNIDINSLSNTLTTQETGFKNFNRSNSNLPIDNWNGIINDDNGTFYMYGKDINNSKAYLCKYSFYDNKISIAPNQDPSFSNSIPSISGEILNNNNDSTIIGLNDSDGGKITSYGTKNWTDKTKIQVNSKSANLAYWDSDNDNCFIQHNNKTYIASLINNNENNVSAIFHNVWDFSDEFSTSTLFGSITTSHGSATKLTYDYYHISNSFYGYDNNGNLCKFTIPSNIDNTNGALSKQIITESGYDQGEYPLVSQIYYLDGCIILSTPNTGVYIGKIIDNNGNLSVQYKNYSEYQIGSASIHCVSSLDNTHLLLGGESDHGNYAIIINLNSDSLDYKSYLINSNHKFDTWWKDPTSISGSILQSGSVLIGVADYDDGVYFNTIPNVIIKNNINSEVMPIIIISVISLASSFCVITILVYYKKIKKNKFK